MRQAAMRDRHSEFVEQRGPKAPRRKEAKLRPRSGAGVVPRAAIQRRAE